jgi:hypothetical protein
MPLADKLVLQRWLFDLFGVEHFSHLARHLRESTLEGCDENNRHHLHHALCLHLREDLRPQLPDDLLLTYDQSIVAVTQKLNERRLNHGQAPIVWKYYQYLALLFTEIYLDRYFRDPYELAQSIGATIESFNETLSAEHRVTPFVGTRDSRPLLNKLAFWMATGSGKTLLMHAHLLQYRQHVSTHCRARDHNRIILLTPNEGLSLQHLREFEVAGIRAELFRKDATGSAGVVEILEVTKLRDEEGEKTVAVESFEGNNLVLVDEGHRGAKAGEAGAWMRARNTLCENGFSFEYSATFGQAVTSTPAMSDLYARSVLFDYSYRWFHADGFGKDYEILNLEDDTDPEWLATYLTGCLLAFFQQQRVYRVQRDVLSVFNVEPPLMLFVGGSVTATLGKQETSDIVEILQFMSMYVTHRNKTIKRIRRLLHEGLVNSSAENIFAGRFGHLNGTGLTASEIFQESLELVFNSPGGGALHLENLKGVPGEIALRVGSNDTFGLVNVGDAGSLAKRCREAGLDVDDSRFSDSMFHELERSGSTVNVLIGAKKFTEGWNSWRVSTIGLMNVGRGEGAQIIQLFGRGVRLKGHEMSLKRSRRAELPTDLVRPPHMDVLETLHVFGVRADYMMRFGKILQEERNEKRIELVLPLLKTLGTRRLKTIRVAQSINGVRTELGNAFRELAPCPSLRHPDPDRDPSTAYLQEKQVVVSRYPRIATMGSTATLEHGLNIRPNQAHFTSGHISFLNLDDLFFELERFKAERGWHSLHIPPNAIHELLADTTWYRILIPASDLAFDSYDKVREWQEIALTLLKKYTEHYYTFRKREWELPHLEYADLSEDDPNFLVRGEGQEAGYRILVDQSQHEVVERLKALEAAIRSGDPRPWRSHDMGAICFDRHLYQPLLYVDRGALSVTPTPLNPGERRFVEDLMACHSAEDALFEGMELYLLRNLSKGHGIGFFEADNFHPDFILWLLLDDRQHIVFVDPKGMLHLPADHPKIRFHETIKEIEKRLGDPKVQLDSFIISVTPSHQMQKQWGLDKAVMTERHILFQEEDRDSYLWDMIKSVVADGSARYPASGQRQTDG